MFKIGNSYLARGFYSQEFETMSTKKSLKAVVVANEQLADEPEPGPSTRVSSPPLPGPPGGACPPDGACPPGGASIEDNVWGLENEVDLPELSENDQLGLAIKGSRVDFLPESSDNDSD